MKQKLMQPLKCIKYKNKSYKMEKKEVLYVNKNVCYILKCN